MNSSFFRKIGVVYLIGIGMIVTYYRFQYLYPYAATWDQVDFVLALEDFDLLKMQPHFPGYPYFILGGTLLGSYFQNGPESLSLFNQLMFVFNCIPIYYIAREWLPFFQSLLVVLAIQTTSYVTVMTAQPMSEGAALAVTCWFLWSLLVASKKDHVIFDLMPFFLFSLLLGIRLSYIAIGVGLIFHLYNIWKRDKLINYPYFFLLILLAIMFQFIWIGALAMNVGGFSTLWKLAVGFSGGHFTEWGGTAEEGSLFLRLIKLVFINLLWVGFASEKVFFILVLMTLVIIAIYSRRKNTLQNPIIFQFLIICFAYFCWALLAQNIDKPRHILPIVLISLLLFTIKLLRTRSLMVTILLCLWIFGQGVTGIQLLAKQATEMPAVYQLESSLNSNKEKFVIYTWEETRIFEYLHSPFAYKRVFSYDKFALEISSYKSYGKTIYVTDQVVKGFNQQGIDLSQKVKKISHYTSNHLFDPVYADIVLYEWID